MIIATTKTYLRQCPSLIREYVLDLSQIVRQIPGPGKRSLIRLLIPYILVEINERGLTSSHEFDRNVQGYRDNVLEPK
jgi:hypothetical protein